MARGRSTPTAASASLWADVAEVEVAALPIRAETPATGGKALAEGAPIRIERLILHALDAAHARLRLVDAEVALDAASESFFAGHLLAAGRRADWRARFTDEGGPVAVLCRELLDGPEQFVRASRLLAQRLYDAMCLRPQQISPGDFVVIVYRIADAKQRHIALLKLDPDARLVREFTEELGRVHVRITTASNLLPDTTRLQKCALLSAPHTGAPFEVALLDTQAGPRSEGVAAFFYRGFLMAELAPSPRRRTRLFLAATEHWLSGVADSLTPLQMLAFYRARRAALAGATVHLATFARAALSEAPALRAALEHHLRETFTDPVDGTITAFPVDRATADPVVRCVTLELDGGARLRVDAPDFDRLVRLAPQRTGNTFQLTLTSVTLKEVTSL